MGGYVERWWKYSEGTITGHCRENPFFVAPRCTHIHLCVHLALPLADYSDMQNLLLSQYMYIDRHLCMINDHKSFGWLVDLGLTSHHQLRSYGDGTSVYSPIRRTRRVI